MKCHIILLFIAAWILFAFARCDEAKPAAPYCKRSYRLHNGVVCQDYWTDRGNYHFWMCSDGMQHLNPPAWTEEEWCGKKFNQWHRQLIQ